MFTISNFSVSIMSTTIDNNRKLQRKHFAAFKHINHVSCTFKISSFPFLFFVYLYLNIIKPTSILTKVYNFLSCYFCWWMQKLNWTVKYFSHDVKEYELFMLHAFHSQNDYQPSDFYMFSVTWHNHNKKQDDFSLILCSRHCW